MFPAYLAVRVATVMQVTVGAGWAALALSFQSGFSYQRVYVNVITAKGWLILITSAVLCPARHRILDG
jgi:hypothetical protein